MYLRKVNHCESPVIMRQPIKDFKLCVHLLETMEGEKVNPRCYFVVGPVGNSVVPENIHIHTTEGIRNSGGERGQRKNKVTEFVWKKNGSSKG